MNERDFAVLARIALGSGWSAQACACSGVSNTMMTNRFGATPSTARDVLAADQVLAAETSQDFRGGFGRERFETFRVGDLAEVDDEISWRQRIARSIPCRPRVAERDGGGKRNREFLTRVS